MLNPTHPDKLVDAQGRPYFLWDVNLNLDSFKQLLENSEIDVRAYWAGKLMRQAKPDDVFTFLSLSEISSLWPHLQPYLGQTRQFWSWLLVQWKAV